MPSVTCYATPGKVKALRLCETFAAGVNAAGGSAALHCGPLPERLLPGAAVFYGVTPATAHLWAQAKAEGRDWFYIDNSYFDVSRGTSFRVTKNRLQHSGAGVSDGQRRAALGVKVSPQRSGGDLALICLQSDAFLKNIAGVDPVFWLRCSLDYAQSLGLPVHVRQWDANKTAQARSLHDDLKHAAVVITHSSAAAVEARLAGIPVNCAPVCAAYNVAPEDRDRWADVLADNQWTLAELRDGTAWKALND